LTEEAGIIVEWDMYVARGISLRDVGCEIEKSRAVFVF
jgi:hypothetical protein